jgi:hypothetical protein
MNIDIDHVPFARLGSYLTFSVLPSEWGHTGLVLRTMHLVGPHEVFHIHVLRDGEPVSYDVTATPTLCTLRPEDDEPGKVEICLPETDVARIRATGVSVRLQSVATGRGHYAFDVGGGAVNLNCPANGVQYLVFSLRGELRMEKPVHIDDHKRGGGARKPEPEGPALTMDFVPGPEGDIEFALAEYLMTPRTLQTLSAPFEEAHKLAEADWQNWLDGMPVVPPEYAEAAVRAMHVSYASTVGPWGNFRQPAMLMSRNWMTACWSWDHCFNAVALSTHDPDLAWDQLNIHFDLQEPGGCLPDGVRAETAGWNFCKPPVHGWALARMTDADPELLTPERAGELYPKLARWTEWWFRARDNDGDGLPEYHHGNDSGWDNATVFDGGFPVCGADLQAFLILQMDMLARLAQLLDRADEAGRWAARAKAHLERMIAKLWDGEQFRAKRAFSYEVPTGGNSLINHVPIVLGERLPAEIAGKIAHALRPDGPFVTAFGPATEDPKSPKYVERGYWRGPIWAPVVVLIADGLRHAGFTEQAVEIARRYCEMCRRSMTFAENYDPLSGAPLCDRAYTWASSAFMFLATEFLTTG